MDKKVFLETLYKRHSGNVKLGLERMFSILQKMDSPHLKLKGIHIAGTNGKGSTAAMCEALGLAHGLTTGLNTSPHLVEYNERIRLNGIDVNYDELMKIYDLWHAVFEEQEASFFEISTVFAFYLFYHNQLDFSIFEVGLGGRLDGTNPFQSSVTAITSISYDHPKSLGETIEEIAGEKAGILKRNVPVVIGEMPDAAKNVILKKAETLSCPIHMINRDFLASNIRMDETGVYFDYESLTQKVNGISLNLLGKHQISNAAVALRSFELFMQQIGKQPDSEKIRQSLANINWMGRMQKLQKEPTVILDGAHNEEGIAMLVENLKILYPQKRILFVTAILKDKKMDSIFMTLCTISKWLIISQNQSARAAEMNEQLQLVRKYTTECEGIQDVNCALEKALAIAKKEDVIVVCGSLYTIAEVLQKRNCYK